MCLKKAIGGARLSYYELLTVTTQLEATHNSRPLTYVSSEDLEEPITPSHLLVGYRLLILPECESNQSDPDFSLTSTPMVITQRMRHMKLATEHFWKRWLNEYPKELRDAHRYAKQPRGSGCIGVGDMVLVHDTDHSRVLWKTGIVEKLITGKDGVAQGAFVRLSSARGPVTLRCPLQLLYPLEMSAQGPAASSVVTHDAAEPVDAKDSSMEQN